MGTAVSVTILWRQNSGKESAFAREKLLQVDHQIKNIAKAQKEEFPAAMKKTGYQAKNLALIPTKSVAKLLPTLMTVRL